MFFFRFNFCNKNIISTFKSKFKNYNTMKTIIFLIAFIGLAFSNYAQKQEFPEIALPIDQETKLITYSHISPISANKDSLYRKAEAWVNNYFKNPTSVVREKSPEKGEINGKHQIKILNPADKKGVQTMKGIVQYTIKVNVKENKVRLVLNEFNFKSTSYTPIETWADKTNSQYSPINNFYFEQIDKEMKSMLEHFKNFMEKSNEVKSDNW